MHIQARMKLSVELPPTLELSPALKTPRTVKVGACSRCVCVCICMHVST